jgi:hypothetical protein
MTDGMGSGRTGTEKIGTNRRTKRADAEMTDAEMTDADRIDAERIEADQRAIRYSGFAPEERTTATLRSLQTARDYKARHDRSRSELALSVVRGVCCWV